MQITILPGNFVIDRMVVQLDFPKGAIIMTVKRKNEYIIPVGSTIIQEDDKLFILAEDKRTVELVYASLHMPLPVIHF